ncbi:hypothetical protein CROQUDRAFT_276493 [Cronartium quercuum f. sp. fusiforme G11]|uniref:Uncharacterized protein n=1 Tax=Cronartium quercuum f. sp. fusiforme G11 TaxID=708437 RepID=A0A9P6NUR2_9BASI|nr:hypothetical protein CROQUDRAFT_276493 [Cronartium quercuum f. sp. fusiforme G11]
MSLLSVTLKSASPFTILTKGIVRLSKGPLPNKNLDFEATWTFSGDHPVLGQLTTLDQIVIGASQDQAIYGIGASGGSSSSGSSGGGGGGSSDTGMDLVLPDFHNMSSEHVSGLVGVLLPLADHLKSGNYSGAFIELGPGVQILFQSDVTGGAIVQLRNAIDFLYEFRRTTFEGRLTVRVSDVFPVSMNPFAVGFIGNVTTDAGPTAWADLNIRAVLAFRGPTPNATEVTSFRLEVEGFSDGTQLSWHLPEIKNAPILDPNFEYHEAVRAEGLVLRFGEQLQKGNYEEAYHIMGDSVTCQITNQLTGKDFTSHTSEEFADAFDKTTAGGRLKVTLNNIQLASTSPPAIQFTGTALTSAGPGKNQHINYVASMNFNSGMIQAGQVSQFTITLTEFSDGHSAVAHKLKEIPLLGPTLAKLTG